jgi:hypothetical protein
MVEEDEVVEERARGELVDYVDVVEQRRCECVWRSDGGCVVHDGKLVKDVGSDCVEYVQWSHGNEAPV